MKTAFLLCGEPGSGKTTVIMDVIAKAGKSCGGFYTGEIRTGGIRQGFSITTLDGKSATLAHVGINSRQRVGKYGVDVGSMEEVAVPALREAIRSCDVVVIDEIGKMELYSSSFKEAVVEALRSGKKVLGTIMLAPHSWADGVKKRPEVAIITVTRNNRSEVVRRVLEWLEA